LTAEWGSTRQPGQQKFFGVPALRTLLD